MACSGFWRAGGHVCEVIAPSLIPRRAGDRIKTDRRDALSLAALLRAGQLTAIWVPDADHEAVRSLVRLRALAVSDVVRAKQQILSFCLLHERCYEGKTPWTKTHRRWLVEQRFDHAALSFSYSELLDRLERAEAMLARVRAELQDSLADWALYPVVEALRALRGIDWENAAIVVAEIGDFSRFASPRQLMAYVGLVPSEASSGEKRRRGGLDQDRQWRGAQSPDRGGLELSLPGPAELQDPPAIRRSARADPGQGLAGPEAGFASVCVTSTGKARAPTWRWPRWRVSCSASSGRSRAWCSPRCRNHGPGPGPPAWLHRRALGWAAAAAAR